VASLSSINFKIGADLKDFRSSMRNIDRSLSNMSRGFGALGATIGAAFVVDRIAQFGKEASELAGKAEGVENAFRRFADPTLLNDLRTATRGTASDLELMTSAVKAQQFGIPMKEMTRLLEFASRRAQETGESIDYMLNSVIVGIGRKSPKILDNLGISASRLSKEFNGAAVEAQSIGDVTRVVAKIAEEEMGMFFARRKDDKLRLIPDARAANVYFCQPSYTELTCPVALTVIEQRADDLVGSSSGDVEVCF
jgi:methyl-accepting chemotaxis protein